MTNPTAGWDLVPVFGTYKNLDGTPKGGFVKFTVAERVTRTDGTVIYPRGGSMRVPLGTETGSVSLSFPASDDPDVTPQGFQIKVEEQLTDGSGQTYYIETPLASLPTGVNLAEVVVPAGAPSVPAPLLVKGLPGGIAELDNTGRVPIGQLPDGLGAPDLTDELAAEAVARAAADGSTAAAVADLAALVVPSSTTVRGLVELATTTEAKTGTDTARAVTPAALAGVIADERTAATGTYITVVEHGSTASTARPVGAARVFWRGTVTPTNALVGDRVVNISTPTAPTESIVVSVGPVTLAALSGGGGGGAATTSASDLTSGTLAAARIADGSLPIAKLAVDIATQAELDAVAAAKAPVVESVNTVANSGTAQTLPDVTTATLHDITLTGSCTLTFPTLGAGKSFTVRLTQDSTGGRTVTWPATVKWPAGTSPTLSTVAGKQDVFTFVSFAGTSWMGGTFGLDVR